jgi:sarcosine oxidase subunit beta
MPEKVDALVIGSGIIGLSCAAALCRGGLERVVVAEKEASFGQGSSSRANGGVRAQFTTPVNISFSLYSIGEFERMAGDHPDLLTFHQSGYLLFTGDSAKAAGLEAAAGLQRSLGVDTELLDPGEVAHRAEVVSASGLVAATFHRRDGFLDPWSAVLAMGREAKEAGANLRTTCAVLGLETDGDGWTVSTSAGGFRARYVIDAAGADAAEIALIAGVELPVEPVRRNLAFIQDSPRALIPMCVDLDTGVLVRRESHGGYVVAYSDPDDLPGRDITVDPNFLPAVAARIGNRFPQLATMPIDPRQCWAGLYPETPDHHAIVGEAPGTPGLFICAGFGGHGIMHSPAAGKAIAELVVDGECSTFDIGPLRPSRFAEGDLVTETAVL